MGEMTKDMIRKRMPKIENKLAELRQEKEALIGYLRDAIGALVTKGVLDSITPSSIPELVFHQEFRCPTQTNPSPWCVTDNWQHEANCIFCGRRTDEDDEVAEDPRLGKLKKLMKEQAPWDDLPADAWKSSRHPSETDDD